MSDVAYPKFGSIPRLHRPFTITEKIDGTNGLISIVDTGSWDPKKQPAPLEVVDTPDGTVGVLAGSRNRWLSIDNDNFGFAAWVSEHALRLAETLGIGNHYGEWYGYGIQRGYGLDHKRFALFNTKRWSPEFMSDVDYVALDVVPTVRLVAEYDDTLHLNTAVFHALERLRIDGSLIAPGFERPEGIVVYHHAANQYFKVTLDGDEMPKSMAMKAAA